MKIAFLFLTIGDLNQEYLWREYFKGNDKKYSIYCHPKKKDNVNSKWFKNYIINKTVDTSWGKTIYAIVELLKEALKDKENEYFFLLSESCIPIKSFKTFYKFLSKNENKSFIKKFTLGLTEYDKKARLINLKNKEKYNIIKHYANWILNRHHVKKLLFKEEDLKNFLNVDNHDEFFLSVIYNEKSFIDYEITNVDWKHVLNFREQLKKVYYNINEQQGDKNILEEHNKLKDAKDTIFKELSKHPRTYYLVNETIINELINTDSFFARKFDKKSNVSEFKNQLIAS